jgi:hypothetical protein
MLVEMTEYLVKSLVTDKEAVTVKEFPSDDEKLTELFYTAYITKLDGDYISLSFDSLINPDKIINPYPPNCIGNLVEYNDLEKEPNFGYSPIDEIIPELELCLETEECKEIPNLSGIEDITFEKVTPSGTGRYTMELWLKIKNLNSFLNGINIIWYGHSSISALADSSKNQLSLYCFPQDYLSSPYNIKGRKII